MASTTRGGSDRAKNSNMAAYMKKHGIRRTTARCSVCYRIVGLPLDRHLFGGACK